MLLAAALACAPLRAASAAAPDNDHPTPVLVELFTSEGCSDCPPADDLLMRLDREQFVPGVHAIVLSEHVTYWNHQGWRDPFSMQEIDWRQEQYQDRFKLQSAYTPQMVVDGAQQFLGNSSQALDRAMAQAASDTKQPLQIVDARWENDGVHFAVHTDAAHGEHLYAALAEDVDHSQVSSGENAGRTLHHVAVVRVLKDFKSEFANARALTLSASAFKKESANASVRLVVFLSDPRTGRVDGVAEQMLSKP